MYTWHPKQNQVFLPVSGFPHLIGGDFLCQMTQLRSQFFSLGQVGCLNWWIDMLAKVGEVDVLITRQPPDKGPNQSISSMYISTFLVDSLW